ncbi:MAG: hypothetical protein A2915_02220 [Candidatus Yanofskybacteria bacterium RIFCSPLOWO2_01_FULL_41_34]|nr:MAG: hypothetical protein A2915_02220 [Candidatus Yanofskybacteria bacterium RIFCSPLOWO2_01_FULL_41_34]
MQPANNVNRVRSQVLEIDSYRRSPIASKPTEARIIPREVFRSNFWKIKRHYLLSNAVIKLSLIENPYRLPRTGIRIKDPTIKPTIAPIMG